MHMVPMETETTPTIVKGDRKPGTISKILSEFSAATDPRAGDDLPPPFLFYVFALFATLAVLGSIVAAVYMAPDTNPMFHFKEEGIVTALSSVCLAMASALAAIVFYLQLKNWNTGTIFWFILATGCLFLSLDEQLMFHERGGTAIANSQVGASQYFRNWNDLIVIGYGVVALAIAKLFWREILKCRVFAILFAMGFFFYAVHTGIDSIVPSSAAWKDIPEEGAKLLSVFTLFLAVTAQLLAMVEKLSSMLAGRGPRQAS